MKILHISDTHGLPPAPEGDFDVIVHSGDFLPNRSYGVKPIEETFQAYWAAENAPKMHHRYWSCPVLITPGNHDFIDVTPHLRAVGIDARLLCNGLLDVDGVSFWGHPWTPPFYDWNWMCGPTEMQHHLAPAVELMNQGGIDVFVSHGPMHGVLDRNQDGDRCGCLVLRDVMKDARHRPKALLHGHIHEAAGVLGWGETPRADAMTVSNAARTQRIVEVTS